MRSRSGQATLRSKLCILPNHISSHRLVDYKMQNGLARRTGITRP